MPHDENWHPILIMDVNPGQIWFRRPKGDEFCGECKLGDLGGRGLRGVLGGRLRWRRGRKICRWRSSIIGLLFVPFPSHFQFPNYIKHGLITCADGNRKSTKTHAHTRASEIWSLGAVIYSMTGHLHPVSMNIIGIYQG